MTKAMKNFWILFDVDRLCNPIFKAVLEQHVSLSDTQAQRFEREKDGKKICWNFRKGRCYKGHNCPLYHDGDLKKVKADETSKTQIRMANRGPTDNDLARMQAQDREQEGRISFSKLDIVIKEKTYVTSTI